VAIQMTKILGFKVYLTTSPKHLEYLKALRASEVFDYKDKNVVDNIVNAAKKDGVTMTGDMMPWEATRNVWRC